MISLSVIFFGLDFSLIHKMQPGQRGKNVFTTDYPKYINIKYKILFENKVFEYYVRIITNLLKIFQIRHYFHVRARHTKKLQCHHATMGGLSNFLSK